METREAPDARREAPDARRGAPEATRQAFGAAANSIRICAALSTVALLAVVAVAGSGHMVNTFMWVRAVLLPVVAVLMHRLTLAASRGSRRAFERVRTLAVVMPVAIIAVDLIPGVCPPWYAAAQVICMLPVIRVALLLRNPALRAHRG
ncbi:hypothetical protein ABZ953_31895 [Streptomyces sp. NPDC046465]|uniref:hypothetical protein n=1 Tax=Streptomyces sp. NPDC046465 TaxID=3155810 RepID=UPI0034052D5C